MEIRKDSLSTVKLCRFCLSQDSQDLRSLYDRSGGRARNNASFSTKILSAVTVEVFPSDKMPSYICSRCSYFMDICYEYKQICRNADESIFQYVQTGSSLKSIAWPAVLTKSYESAKSVSVGSVMKTVVEGGATVEVTSQDASDEDGEEDDENVYKVKIGDGKEEARVKVITGDDSKKPKKEWSPAPRGALDGRYACDECTCTYPLQQLLQLHKLQKHRERTFNCSLCDAKFFSKYDLSSHKLRHTDVKPFECVVCDAKFKKFSLLKRHEKLVHSDLPQTKCPFSDCKVTTLSTEELQRHMKQHVERHSKKGEPNYACDQCDKRFYDRSSLQRHIMTGHNTQEWSCEYCPERFSSVSKLARHVRTHAGERPYPCKYCSKTFMKSHHYTRHVRLKHSDMLDSSYRCDQCGSSFVTQDDLLYHSAIHATQDLTCPLCHEKFENVEGVTAHIRSHGGDGMEFMCDYCELVFTSKLKLDAHTITAHGDEMHHDRASQDESSMEADHEDEDDTFNVKEEGDHMVVEIKKPSSFILSDSKGEIDYRPETDNTCSEESETETSYAEMADSVTMASPTPVLHAPVKPMLFDARTATVVSDKGTENKTLSILRKAEEVKKKLQLKQTVTTTTPKKEEKPVAKVEPNNSGGNDKSLKLLEKELQELQRTNTRQDAAKTPAKPAEAVRSNRRPPLNTSTPKLRSVNEKKAPPATPKTPVEKKVPERRAIKENKEPKEVKTPVAVVKEESKEVKTPVNAKAEKEKANNPNVKEEKDKETKEKDTPKSAVKNGASDNSAEDVRRSTRPSKVKDYAKMAQQKVKEDSENDDSEDGDEEYAEDTRPRGRRVSGKKPTKPTPRKRGRPRKTPNEVPSKVRKQSNGEEEEKSDPEEGGGEENRKDETPEQEAATTADKSDAARQDTGDQVNAEQKSNVLKSPMGQTLKKVPIKSLPPGVKPLPLPTNVRPMGSGSISEMQIGKKMVKVQKIVMTKAEVEAMAKKGLLEMKDGTMVLKQGIKLPTSDPNSIKSSLVGEESSGKKPAPTPTRCDMDDNVTN